MYTEKQLKHAFQCGAIVKENLLNRVKNIKKFNLDYQFKYFKDKVLIKDNPVPSIEKQNGVEANKEQPKIKCKCGTNNPTCDIECG